MRDKVLLYLFLGIACSILPILLTLLLYLLLGNLNQNINGIKMELIPDLLLTTFAIAINTISVLWDSSDDKFFLRLKGLLTAISALIGFTAFYTVFSYITAVNSIMFEIGNIDQASEAEIHEASLKIDKAKDIVLNKVNWTGFAMTAVVIILINLIIGISAIYRDFHPRTNQSTDNTKIESDNVKKEGVH